ncbi:hypothetical protein DSBG_3105 [Desulfosporosinus sp. BG]|nr:hypothetical protein DSBG_3105 [Desulfosporosinus sp. BG]
MPLTLKAQIFEKEKFVPLIKQRIKIAINPKLIRGDRIL